MRRSSSCVRHICVAAGLSVLASCVLPDVTSNTEKAQETGAGSGEMKADPVLTSTSGQKVLDAGAGSTMGADGMPRQPRTTQAGGSANMDATQSAGAQSAAAGTVAAVSPNMPVMTMGGSAATAVTAGNGGATSATAAAGTGGVASTATTSQTGENDPVIPSVAGDCPKFTNGTIAFMGLSSITVVAGAKKNEPTAPMVFYWHGPDSFADEYTKMASAVQQGVVSEGGVLISFQGTTGGDLLSGTALFGKGDFQLTDQLLACAVRDHSVDPKRVYATGCSSGGLFTVAMAAARANYMAAVASNSGGWNAPIAFQNMWTPALMTMHGAPGSDMVVVDFATTSATADKAFKARGGFVINCNHGGGNCGGSALAPDIWRFFQVHTYGLKPSPWAGGLPSGFSSKCMIY